MGVGAPFYFLCTMGLLLCFFPALLSPVKGLEIGCGSLGWPELTPEGLGQTALLGEI